MFNIDTMDDAVITDESSVFNGGQYSNARPSNLPENYYWLGQNVDQTVNGRLITRRGTITIGQNFANYPLLGLAYYQTPSASEVIAIISNGTDGKVYHWTGTTWALVTGANFFSPIQPTQMIQGIDKLWIVQNGFNLASYDGSNVDFQTTTGGNTEPPLAPTLVEWHTSRLVLAGMSALPDTVSFSAYLNGALWDHANWDLRVGTGDGDPITGLRAWTNFNLVVFKQHSIWVINCDPGLADPVTGNISGFTINPVHRRIGCMAPNTAVQVGADIFFLSESGVRSVARTAASESQSQVGPALSEPISDLIARINPAGLKWATAFYWNNRYLLSVPLDSSTYPNYILVYNTLTSSWSGYWTGLSPTCWTRRINGSTAQLLIGQSNGKVTDFRDWTPESSESLADFEDDGALPIPTAVESRAFTCGDQDQYKTGLFTRLEFKQSQGIASVSALPGRTENPILLDTFSTSNATVILPATLPFILPSSGFLPKSLDLMRIEQWREVRIRVTCPDHKISLNKISVGAFIDTFVIQE